MTDKPVSKYRSDYFANIRKLGIIGGMGVLSSARLHYDICKLSSLISPEQRQLPSILFSYPYIPDRTEMILAGNFESLHENIVEVLRQCEKLDVSHIIICCFTYHILVKNLEEGYKKRIVSLLDYTSDVLAGFDQILVLCTSASAQYKIFGENPNIVYPSKKDQRLIHKCILKLKSGVDKELVFNSLSSIVAKYHCENVLIGCTDLYLLSYFFTEHMKNKTIINPLELIKFDVINNWSHLSVKPL